jgi:hypothetical protein
MTKVMLGQSTVPMFMFTVHGHVRPIGGNGRCDEGVPRARQKYAKGVGRSRAYVAGVGWGGNHSRQGVGRFDDVMGARARRKAALSLTI